MWVIGDWGQSDPWTRASGVRMTKGEDGLYTGVLTLPKGTRFDLKILRNPTVGQLIWSATRYTSVLNSDGAYDFGEFTDNLVPNGNFDEGKVKWTPADAIIESSEANTTPNLLTLGGASAITSCSSDVFTIPPMQTLRLSGYISTSHPPVKGVVTMKIVTPQQQTLFECDLEGNGNGTFRQFSKTFKSMDVPMECRITLSNTSVGEWWLRTVFDSLSLVSP